MCFLMLNPCWSNTKRFLSVLVVFGKSFVFTKMSKFSKTMMFSFGNSVEGWSSRMSQLWAHTEIFSRLTGESMPQSRKILRIFFKIWVFDISRDSVWWLVRGQKVQSWESLEIFTAYLATLSQVELPVAKNT